MPSRAKVLGDGSICRQKALGMSRRFKPLHAIFALACGAMRVLTAVVQIATLAMFHPRQDFTLRRAVALELIGNDDPRHVLGFFAQPPSCRALHERGYAESQIMPGNTW